MYEPSCSCTLKLGQHVSPLGRVDGGKAGDVAVAVDPATGHLYADDQSSVAEWDTGAMNRNSVIQAAAHKPLARSSRASARPNFRGLRARAGSPSNGASGEIYVSNPADGKVYVFGSDAPAVTVSEPTGVTRDAASLSGMVDPRGAAVSECEFEYGAHRRIRQRSLQPQRALQQTPAEIGAGSGPVAVSARLEGLEPGELYHFRLIATNANGAGEGSGLLATQGVGFGIKNFEISFLNEDGTPDTQAGSHPYLFLDTFELNSHFKRVESNADSAVHSPARRRLAGSHGRSAPRLRRRPQCDPPEVHRRRTTWEWD